MILPAPSGKTSPSLPTAHSMNRPGPPIAPPRVLASTMLAFIGLAASFCWRKARTWCVIVRASLPAGLISIAFTQRGSVSPVGVTGRHHLSIVSASSVKGSEATTRSGAPNSSTSRHSFGSGNSTGAGRSAGSPSTRPPSIHASTVSISSPDRLRSFRNSWIPTVGSRCHGGMMRLETFSRMLDAQR